LCPCSYFRRHALLFHLGPIPLSLFFSLVIPFLTEVFACFWADDTAPMISFLFSAPLLFLPDSRLFPFFDDGPPFSPPSSFPSPVCLVNWTPPTEAPPCVTRVFPFGTDRVIFSFFFSLVRTTTPELISPPFFLSTLFTSYFPR